MLMLVSPPRLQPKGLVTTRQLLPKFPQVSASNKGLSLPVSPVLEGQAEGQIPMQASEILRSFSLKFFKFIVWLFVIRCEKQQPLVLFKLRTLLN